MIDRPVSREALDIFFEIKDLIPTFGKAGSTSFSRVVPKELEREVLELLDNAGIFFHLENFFSETTDFRIYIPEKYQKKKK